MDTPIIPLMDTSLDPRCGFHYFPDTLHYRQADLTTWLPELQALGASWLVLRSETDRAIPEIFLRGIKQAGIRPVIQFQLGLESLPALKEISILLDVYARWGARYVVFYDRPNRSASWPASGWVQQDLVERFLDRFLPVANLALSSGMIPVFPPLQPGGSYWDTAFLRSALQAVQRRKQDALLQSLVLSAYAWTGGHSLNWGAGGPDAWPQARPYLSLEENQDQRGFRIYEWYQNIARDVLHQTVPIILFQSGLPGDPDGMPAEAAQNEDYFEDLKRIARLAAGEDVPDPTAPDRNLAALPRQVIACNYWLLSATPASKFAGQALFSGDSSRSSLVKWLVDWRRERSMLPVTGKYVENAVGQAGHPIRHYLLLPGSEWGISDWYLEIIRPFVKKHLPTVGFSSEEAERAELVTIVGNSQNYPEDMLGRLQNAGCRVELINGDGTKIASELAER